MNSVRTLKRCSTQLQTAKRFVQVEARIAALGITLAEKPADPKGVYVPFAKSGNMIYFAGHLPQDAEGKLLSGRLGENYTVEEGKAAARSVGIQLLASMKSAVGDLDKVKRVVKLVGFVNSTPAFTQQPMVINGCSELMSEVFGPEVGSHARSAVGTNVLPLGVPVEIEAIIEVRN